MNEDMKQAWLTISQMLGETTNEELDVFLRTWQLAIQAERKQWVGLTDEEIEDLYFDKFSMGELKAFARAIEAAHGIKGQA